MISQWVHIPMVFWYVVLIWIIAIVVLNFSRSREGVIDYRKNSLIMLAIIIIGLIPSITIIVVP
jgi:hypothetical protein